MVRIIKVLFFVVLVISVIPAKADKYKILYANSSKIRIGDRPAVKGLVFEDKSQIHWTSDEQALKVLNLTTNRVSVIPAVVYKKNWSESLFDLLVKVKHMSTRGYGQFSIEADTVCYMLDTLRIDAGRYHGSSTTDNAVLVMDGDSIITDLRKSNDKREFILTRKIYGGKKIKTAYIDIVETDADKDWTYYIYKSLYIVQLPLNTD